MVGLCGFSMPTLGDLAYRKSTKMSVAHGYSRRKFLVKIFLAGDKGHRVGRLAPHVQYTASSAVCVSADSVGSQRFLLVIPSPFEAEQRGFPYLG